MGSAQCRACEDAAKKDKDVTADGEAPLTAAPEVGDAGVVNVDEGNDIAGTKAEEGKESKEAKEKEKPEPSTLQRAFTEPTLLLTRGRPRPLLKSKPLFRTNSDPTLLLALADRGISASNFQLAPSEAPRVPALPPGLPAAGGTAAAASSLVAQDPQIDDLTALLLASLQSDDDGAWDSGLEVCVSCGAPGMLAFCQEDRSRYCHNCHFDWFGRLPSFEETEPLVPVHVVKAWYGNELENSWEGAILPGWPMLPEESTELAGRTLKSSSSKAAVEKDTWSNVAICVRRGVVGPHAREQNASSRVMSGTVLKGRYKIVEAIGEGNFTKAFLARDLRPADKGGLGDVCVKCYHRSLGVDAVADLMVLGKRLKEVDEQGTAFPLLHDAFFDLAGFTVENLIPGQNCYSISLEDRMFFQSLTHLGHVARGALKGLQLLEKAGIVHNDLKPDNIVWLEDPRTGDGSPNGPGDAPAAPSVRIVDFGCARLDQNEDPGQNWNMAEGGAGHLGYASPEMALGLPVTHRSDVWSLGVLLCELHSGRNIWFREGLTPEEVIAQGLGLCGLQHGMPSSLLRRSPLDIRQVYTPAFMFAKGHYPVCRCAGGRLEVLRPARCGLEQILGVKWKENGKQHFRDLLQMLLQIDVKKRPTAKEVLAKSKFVAEKSKVVKKKPAAKAGASKKAGRDSDTEGEKASTTGTGTKSPAKQSTASTSASSVEKKKASDNKQSSAPPAKQAAAAGGEKQGAKQSFANVAPRRASKVEDVAANAAAEATNSSALQRRNSRPEAVGTSAKI
eukprot:TRINITY_DN101721_c0_g1_i1.p1 TRINITY_DN101721_c0_g1~~TRINITY_DN101721_c0_g1_i1.p1  ORF type:complete len:787 (+),score=181.99 TRINITY_DN101721_c0_g1_i1:144-2504(+)